MNLKDRFLKYVSFDTQSDENSTTFPSTDKQLVLLNHLADEMRSLGLQDVTVDKYGYAMGTIPASEGCKKRPRHRIHLARRHLARHERQRRKTACHRELRRRRHRAQRLAHHARADFPELPLFKGHTIIHTDGTTLLGADDKAGCAEIMTAAEYLMSHPEIKHGKIRLGFTPDEEIGRGVDYFDVKAFGADFAYTMDGGYEGELEYENFNAASATIDIQGRNVHPGYAKDKMINALQVACEFNSLLPADQRPEHTEGYEGFYHCVGLNGTVESARISYIIRDHDSEKFEQKKVYIWSCVDLLQKRYGKDVLTLTLKDQYYNMRKMVEPHPHVIEKAERAMEMADVTPVVRPIRAAPTARDSRSWGCPAQHLHGRHEFPRQVRILLARHDAQGDERNNQLGPTLGRIKESLS